MSKAKSYKIFVNGKGFDAVGHQVMVPCFVLERPNHDVLYYPWGMIENVRVDHMAQKIFAEQQKQRQEDEKSLIEIPRGVVGPLDPNAPPN